LELEPVEGGPRIYADVWKYGFTGPEGREYLSTLPMKDRNAYLEMWMANAITAHSSQGSERNHVLLVNEAHVFRPNDDKWLYTAATRARGSVTVVRSIQWTISTPSIGQRRSSMTHPFLRSPST